MKKKRIVVTGMGLVSCFGTNIDQFYQRLLAGESGVGPIDQFPCQDYPTRFAASVKDCEIEQYLDKKQARRVDPYIRYAVVAGKKALEQAQLTGDALNKLQKERCGIIMGSGMGGMSTFADGVETLVNKGFKRISPFFVPYIITNMGGALLAIELGFLGPNYSISTACATSNYCIIAAAQHIQNGESDLIICGGTEAPICPIGVSAFVACKALSERNDAPTQASRPWDQGRDGFVIGEGAGALVLESLEHAQARGAPIYAEYLGGSTSCDAHHMTDPRPDGYGVSLCIEGAIKNAGISKEAVNYINAHATATLAGDLAEIRAIRHCFGSHTPNIKINGTKSMIGHCLGAASAIEAIATIQAIRTDMLHPTINLDNPEPEVSDIDLIAHRAKAHKVQVALSNSFGFGGHNSCIALTAFKE